MATPNRRSDRGTLVTAPGHVTVAARRRRWVTLVLALLVLNASLAFRNIWPTPAVWWTGEASVELAVALVLLLALRRVTGYVSRRALSCLTAVWGLLVIGRYADVTAPALLGREINLFWDVRYTADVAAMFLKVASPLAIAAAAAAGVAVMALLYRSLRWALGRVAAAVTLTSERRAVATGAFATTALFLTQLATDGRPPIPRFSKPVVMSFVRHATLVAEAFDTSTVGQAPPAALASDLSLVAGADVLLVFLESYGAVTWQRPAFVDRLAGDRARLEAAVLQARQDIVSTYVESPTFGGSSWFAHLSLLSGIEIRDPNAHARLMIEKRDTLVTTFAHQGYRAIAVMPGLWQPWPEGSFYGFQDIYGGERLGYKGPQFGWWAIPDQFALAQLGALELSRVERPPLFVFFPTVSTHTPFAPAPLYQPDWTRMLTAQPFDEAEVIRRFDDQPDWTNLSPSYADAVAYTHTVLTGFLEQPRSRDLVMVLLGDHQPPALVTGEGASWNVPVHVITSRRAILERLRAQGFASGLEPRGTSIGRMHELLPILLDSFGDRLPPASANARLVGQPPLRTVQAPTPATR